MPWTTIPIPCMQWAIAFFGWLWWRAFNVAYLKVSQARKRSIWSLLHLRTVKWKLWWKRLGPDALFCLGPASSDKTQLSLLLPFGENAGVEQLPQPHPQPPGLEGLQQAALEGPSSLNAGWSLSLFWVESSFRFKQTLPFCFYKTVLLLFSAFL